MQTLTDTLNTVISHTLTNYRGRILERINEHNIRVGKLHYNSEAEAKQAVDQSYSDLAASVSRSKIL